jgi:poly(ADP-ribose) glycohydrolase ARH3
VTEDRLTGCILGQALGDALGFVVEAQPPEVARIYVDGWLRTGRAGEWAHPQYPFGQYSDDTQLARELLRSFEKARGWDAATFAVGVAELFRHHAAVGAGEGTRSAAERLLGGATWEESGAPAPYAGNGSAMRAGPVGLLVADPVKMCQTAREQSWVTHRDPRCSAGSIAVARAVALASRDEVIEPAEFLTDLAGLVRCEDAMFAEALRGLRTWSGFQLEPARHYLYRSGLDPDHMESWRGISAFVIPSVLWALYSFLRSPDDYWETICTAIRVGGDTDTIAGMAGAMCGARVGVEGLPSHLLPRLTDAGEWGAEALAQLARSCLAIAGSRASDAD